MSAQADALRLAGLSHLKAGRNDEAIAVLQQAVRADPESYDTWTYLGFAFSRTANYDTARRAFGRAVQISPQTAKARYNLGMAHQMAGDIEAARVCFESAICLDPPYEQAQAALDKLPPKQPDRPMTMAELSSPGGAVRLPGAHAAVMGDEAPQEGGHVMTQEEISRLSAPQGHIHLMGAQAEEADSGKPHE